MTTDVFGARRLSARPSPVSSRAAIASSARSDLMAPVVVFVSFDLLFAIAAPYRMAWSASTLHWPAAWIDRRGQRVVSAA